MVTTRACVCLLALALSASALADNRPNILFCMADDWGMPHAGAYGDQVVNTPTFDRLAREGARFLRTFASSPSCTPSRNAILTGQQFYRLDQGANLHSTLDPRHPNFMFLLRGAGYQISYYRKAWGPGDPLALGYTENPCGPNVPFKEFMNKRVKDQPFCFWFGTSKPHRPYEQGSGKGSGMNLAKVLMPSFYPDKPEIRSDIADYYSAVEQWDRRVSEALDILNQTGELDNTIVIMTGDHGIPFPRCKGNLYDWGTRVPLVIRWGAQLKGGQTIDEFVSLTDLAPTFLEAAGVTIPDSMTGKSLLPLLTSTGGSPSNAHRDFVVYGRERHTPAQAKPSTAGYPSRAIRTDHWLLILNLEPDRWPAGVPTGSAHPISHFTDCDNGPTKKYLLAHQDEPDVAQYYELCFGKRPAVELYDSESDPHQVRNLAQDPAYAETVEQLRAKLIDYLQSTGDPRFTGAEVHFDDYPYRASYHKPKRGS